MSTKKNSRLKPAPKPSSKHQEPAQEESTALVPVEDLNQQEPQQLEEPKAEADQPEQSQPESPAPEPSSESPTPAPITLEYLAAEIEALKLVIADLQQSISRKRRAPVTNSKVQILDTRTGAVYPSKNNAYQSLLKSGELNPLVKNGLFGDDPPHNTFGWYVLNRHFEGLSLIHI